MNAEAIAAALQLRHIGRGWRGGCPLCGGSKRFQVREGDGGAVLVWCFAGCGTKELIAELQRRGLWPERERREFTPSEKRQYAQALADAKAQARLALAWLTERLFELDLAKTAAVDFASDRIAVDALTAAAAEHYRLSQLDAPGVMGAWRAARLADPTETMRLERGGLAWRATCESLARAVVDSLKGGTRDVA
jgi:phage/plasmid primase-like uncharacterized protein